MKFFNWTLSFAAMAMLVAGFSGCNSSQVQQSDDAAAATEVADQLGHEGTDHDHDAADHSHAAHHGDQISVENPESAMTDMEKMTKTLASFSEEDRESAMKQHFCPLSGEMLGTMGKPQKIEVGGQSVWICCDGCKEKLLADPEKYLEKLKE